MGDAVEDAAKGKRRHPPEFKAKVALEAIRGKFSVPELAERYGVHASLIHSWKRVVLDAAPAILEKGKCALDGGASAKKARLRELEKLQTENAWLQKALRKLTQAQKREAVEQDDANLPLQRRVKLLGINRGVVYYHRRHCGALSESSRPAGPNRPV